ncbi:MAG: DUF5076 domain-containing protein [Hyphomonadaceae bacterium]|nr:DUF5076 domain-containing protein [Hyphomonadaceae bacterium]
MRSDDNLQPFLVAFPMEQGGQQVMLDPGFFHGADEVGVFLADLARHYARAFVQSGRARDMEDALEQIAEYFQSEVDEPMDEGEGSTPT